jgi:hypothetical protein
MSGRVRADWREGALSNVRIVVKVEMVIQYVIRGEWKRTFIIFSGLVNGSTCKKQRGDNGERRVQRLDEANDREGERRKWQSEKRKARRRRGERKKEMREREKRHGSLCASLRERMHSNGGPRGGEWRQKGSGVQRLRSPERDREWE